MTFDESNGLITDHLSGKTIDYVVRNGKLLELHTTCGHCIKLQADVNYDIHFGGQSVKIQLKALTLGAEQGSF